MISHNTHFLNGCYDTISFQHIRKNTVCFQPSERKERISCIQSQAFEWKMKMRNIYRSRSDNNNNKQPSISLSRQHINIHMCVHANYDIVIVNHKLLLFFWVSPHSYVPVSPYWAHWDENYYKCLIIACISFIHVHMLIFIYEYTGECIQEHIASELRNKTEQTICTPDAAANNTIQLKISSSLVWDNRNCARERVQYMYIEW